VQAAALTPGAMEGKPNPSVFHRLPRQDASVRRGLLREPGAPPPTRQDGGAGHGHNRHAHPGPGAPPVLTFFRGLRGAKKAVPLARGEVAEPEPTHDCDAVAPGDRLMPLPTPQSAAPDPPSSTEAPTLPPRERPSPSETLGLPPAAPDSPEVSVPGYEVL